MSWTVTLIAAAFTLLVVIGCGWRGAMPPNFQRGPRLFPYRLVMLLSAGLLLMLIVHMASLAGLLPPPRTY